MSKKDQYIEQARQARLEHKKWINQVRLVVSGLEKNKNAIALNPSESAFGEWLYSKAMTYSISNSKLVLNDMEFLFEQSYEEYHKIYAVLFKDEGRGILASLFGGKKASVSDYKIAGQYYEILVEKSDQLLNKLRIFENQLTATNFEKFDRALNNEDAFEKVTYQAPKQKEQRYYRGSLIED
jgi:hypothetical protein